MCLFMCMTPHPLRLRFQGFLVDCGPAEHNGALGRLKCTLLMQGELKKSLLDELWLSAAPEGGGV
jgi:hypothetical protein